MQLTNTSAYDLGLDQCVSLLATAGHMVTFLFQGHTGTGKSHMLNTLSADKPDFHAAYFDCTTKALGDVQLPKLKALDGQDYVRFATHEELGLHLQDTPILLMIDEIGKAPRSVQNALLRLMHERKMGSYTLHPDSIVFATTNLGAEGLGDQLQAHARNRMAIINVRKPTYLEWIEWGINNGVDHSLLGWVKDNPQCFADFTEVKDPADNEYIFHPKAPGRVSFVTPRSLEKASHILKRRDSLDDQSVTAALMGTIGARAAMDMMAFVKLADQLPSLDQIKTDPANAPVPTSAAAVCMVVYRTLAAMSRDLVDPWMDYMNRLDKEAQGMFANGVRSPRYAHQSLVLTNKKFTNWAMANNYMFAADKK